MDNIRYIGIMGVEGVGKSTYAREMVTEELGVNNAQSMNFADAIYSIVGRSIGASDKGMYLWDAMIRNKETVYSITFDQFTKMVWDVVNLNYAELYSMDSSKWATIYKVLWVAESQWFRGEPTQPWSLRQLLKVLGTVIGRDVISKDLWVRELLHKAERYVIDKGRYSTEAVADPFFIVVDDVRYLNEANKMDELIYLESKDNKVDLGYEIREILDAELVTNYERDYR